MFHINSLKLIIKKTCSNMEISKEKMKLEKLI